MDYLTLGATPSGEDCAQVGTNGYATKARKECTAYKNQLERQFGSPPLGAYLSIKGFPHDFGTYHEVVVRYDENDKEAVEYAFKLEGDSPANWDDEAKKELGI